MPNIDEELEGDRELIVEHTRRDEDAFRTAELEVAMAARAVAQAHVIALRDAGLIRLGGGFAFAEDERHEVERPLLERGSDAAGHGAHHMLDVRRLQQVLAEHGVAEAICGLRHLRLADYIRSGARL